MRRAFVPLLLLLLIAACAQGEEGFFSFSDVEEIDLPAAEATPGTAPPAESAGADATPAAASGGAASPPYSDRNDGTFWSMTPGERDDAILWEILMQPITVYDGGLHQRDDHAYLRENPDGTGERVAQIHPQSQGLHVLSEPNEHGYVLVEAFSNYDNNYYPKDSAALEDAFTIKQGYVRHSHLKEVQVMADHALVIDKLAQRMYIYTDGRRVAELMVSTGLFREDKPWQETPPGEFITVSHVGPFSTHKYMQSQMAIRISGGILIHEVPYEPLADGGKRYAPFEEKLGEKASAGCIRVQRRADENGYNHQWIWENFKSASPYKVIIWDDVNRGDAR